MDRSGIEMCILSLTSPGVQGVADLGQALALARDVNDYASSVVKAHPDRLAAFAAVPLQNPAEAADELERAVKELGLNGALMRVVYPVFRMLFPSQVIRADDSARVMVDVAVRRTKERRASVFENTDIRAMVEWLRHLTG